MRFPLQFSEYYVECMYSVKDLVNRFFDQTEILQILGYSCHAYEHAICKCTPVLFHHLITVHQLQITEHRVTFVDEEHILLLFFAGRKRAWQIIRSSSSHMVDANIEPCSRLFLG